MEESNGADDNSGRTVEPNLGQRTFEATIAPRVTESTPPQQSGTSASQISAVSSLTSSSTVTTIPTDLIQQEYYHGLLPREDCIHLLKKDGDFLVRISQVKPKEPDRQVIISYALDVGAVRHGIRHVVIRKNDGKYQIDSTYRFDSILALVEHYIKTKMPLLFNGILLNPIPRQKWEIRHADIEINSQKPLGAGQFGEVSRGKWKKKAKVVDVAIKQLKTTMMTKTKIKDIMREARIMRNYNHPNVVKMYGIALDEDPIMIVMELVKGGSLEDYFKRHVGKISDAEKMNNMVSGAAWGLEYLHSKKCIHRDIASRNTLYDKHKVLKISDFGLSREGYKYKMTQTRRVPIKWISPEILKCYTYTQASDVFSFGVMIWEIFSDGAEPFSGKQTPEIKKLLFDGYRLPFPENTLPDIKELVEKHMWNANPDDRMTMTEIVQRLFAITGVAQPPRKKNPHHEKTVANKVSDREVSPESHQRSNKGRSPCDSCSHKRSNRAMKQSSQYRQTSSYTTITSNNPDSPGKDQPC